MRKNRFAAPFGLAAHCNYRPFLCRRKRPTRITAVFPANKEATTVCPIDVPCRATYAEAQMQRTAVAKPNASPREFLLFRKPCSFSAIARMRSAAPGWISSYSRYAFGGGRGPEEDSTAKTTGEALPAIFSSCSGVATTVESSRPAVLGSVSGGLFESRRFFIGNAPQRILYVAAPAYAIFAQAEPIEQKAAVRIAFGFLRSAQSTEAVKEAVPETRSRPAAAGTAVPPHQFQLFRQFRAVSLARFRVASRKQFRQEFFGYDYPPLAPRLALFSFLGAHRLDFSPPR